MSLSDRQRAIIDYERSWWVVPGRKASRIRERFGLSPTRYYKMLNELLNQPDAMEYDPLLVRRLRRDRDRRRRARFAGPATASEERT
jgi:hypothetical protein